MKEELPRNESNDFYFDLVENATDLVQVVSDTGDFIYVNKAWCKLLGYTKRAALQLNFRDIVSEEELPHCMDTFARVMHGEEVDNIETIFRSKSGKLFKVSGNISLKKEQGKPTHTRGIFRNITQQHENKKLLELARSRFKAIFSSSNLGVFISEPEGQIIEVNKAFLKMTDYAKKNIYGVNFLDITHPDDKDKSNEKHKKLLKGKIDSFTIEKRFIKKNGKSVWVSVTASKVMDDENNFVSTISVVENIDKRKKLEESENQVNQLRHMILDNASLTVISLDKNGAIQAFNKTAEKLLGYKASEMIGLNNPPFHDIKEIKQRTKQLNEELGTDFKPGLDTFVGRIKLTKKPDEYELTYISKSGERIPVLLSSSPIFDQDGEIDGYVGIGLDLRERKKAEQELEQSRLFAETITKQTPNSIYIVDFDTRSFIYANGYLGHDPQELATSGRDAIKKVIHPDYVELAVSHYDEFVTAEKGKVLEFELKAKDAKGEWRWMFIKETVFKYKRNGGPQQILGVAVDITDRKNAEEELKKYQEGLKALNNIASKSTRSFDELVEESLRIACDYLETQMAIVSNIKQSSYKINYLFKSPDHDHLTVNTDKEYELGSTFSNEVVKSKDVVVIDDSKAYVKSKKKRYANIKANAYIGLPLWVDGDITGTVNFLSFDPKHEKFTEHQIEFTKILSRWIGATIERKNAAEALEQSKLFAEAIATQSPNGIYILDYDTKSYVYSNKVGQADHEGPTEEEYKQMGSDIIKMRLHPDDWEAAYKHFEDFKTMKDNEVIEFEQRVRDGNGGWIWYFIRETIFKRKPDGSPRQILGVAVDITDRKRVEEDLMKLSIVADQTDSGVVISDEEGRTEWVNNAFLEITGYTMEELKGRRPSELLKGPDTEKKTLEYMFKKQDVYEPFNTEVLNYRKDGKPVWFSITNTPVMRDGKFAGKFIEIAIDITEQKDAEFQLIKAKETAERSAKIKEEFLANMSHEIRTPMNSVVGFTDILLETQLTKDQQRYVESIQIAGQNLKVILDDILSFSKLEAGKLTVTNKEFNLHNTITDLTNLFSQRASEKGIDLSFTINTSVPEYVISDQVRLNQILNNLVSNAVKFTEQGEISILAKATVQDKKQVEVEFKITDTGIGIPKNKLTKVFESFTQATADTTRKYGGTGLGLTISKRLVELLGGSIEVNSKVGVGTTFTVTIPMEISTKTHAKDKKEKAKEGKTKFNLDGYRILLCEDNALNQRLASEILIKLANAQLDIAENGKVGLEMFIKGDYDLVLMDLHMPEMDGISTTKKIRTLPDENKKKVPIIAMTADAMEKERKRCFAVGMNDYISKPFQKEELIDKIIAHSSPGGEVQKTIPALLYDLSNLQDVASGDEEFVKDMVKTFIQNVPKDLDILDKHLLKGELELAGKQSHKLKSSLGLIAHRSGLDLATSIEDGIDKGHDYMAELSAELRQVCNKAIVELKKELKL